MSTISNGETPTTTPPYWLGWVFVGCFVVLLGIIIWVSVTVVGSLTKPQPFLDDYIKDEANKKTLAAPMAVALEYESMATRAQGFQVAYGFLVGLVLIAAGMLLFAIGTVSAFNLAGKSEVGQFKLSSTAPGLVPIIAGSVILSCAILKDIRRGVEASMSQGGELKILTEPQKPPRSGKGVE